MKLNIPDGSINASLLAAFEQQERFEEGLKETRKAGGAALTRLMTVAQGHTGQSKIVAGFLLGLYDGRRFKFDLTDFRRTEIQIHDDCMKVLRMDFSPQYAVHACFSNGEEMFEKLAVDWSVTDAAAPSISK